MPNRLAREASPYLQQHAENPVDWYPWGPEALALAAREDRPILLSIGYSACHWCHVMAHECFEDEGIARLMNGWFVNVKVDREERPDLDQVYQLVVQLTGRSGGWPLTVFLTPDQRPFFGGTYFPPVDRHGLPGFPKVLQAIWEAYRTRREEIDAQSAELVRAITEVAASDADASGAVGPGLLDGAARRLLARFDDVHGGFGRRPKFPSPMGVDVLLRAGEVGRAGKTLDAMRAGGIWDQLGGGFHRYSTDERWLVPHFEKMLYDNAQLLRLYVDGWRVTGDDRHAETAREIAAYLAREMTAPDGAFYATTDADSLDERGHLEEGAYFVWTPDQIDAACGEDAEARAAARRVWGVEPGGNFEHTGATVLSLAAPPSGPAEAAALERARGFMLAERARRPAPFRDEKILTSWNALAIGALADAGAALGEPAMVGAAARAMDAIERSLVARDAAGGARPLRLAKDGVAKGTGFLDDHAYLADAALDLYAATGEPRHVGLARSLADAILAHFHDAASDAFFFTPDDGEALLVRARDPHDHAAPSGASVACRALLRLAGLVDPAYAAPATRAIERLAPAAAENPGAMASAVGLVDRLVRGSVEVVVVGARSDPRTRALAAEAAQGYAPDRTIAWLDPGDPESVRACAALAQGKTAGGAPAAYVCRGRACSLPVTTPEALRRAWPRDRSLPQPG